MKQKEIIELLINRRKELGWSLRKVAERMEVSTSTVFANESEHNNPTLYILLKWIDALGLKVEHQVSGDSTGFKVIITIRGENE